MIRHIFMATVKEGTPDEVINRRMDGMRVTKDSVPAIQAIIVVRNLGWAGPTNAVTMTVDIKNKVGFNVLLTSPIHCEVVDKAVEAFRTGNFVMAQIEPQSVS